MIETINKETFTYGQHPWRTVINITTRDNSLESASQIADRILDALCKKDIYEKKMQQLRRLIDKHIEEDGFIDPEEGLLEIEKTILDGNKMYLLRAKQYELEDQLQTDPAVPSYCAICDHQYTEKCGCYNA